MAQSYAQKYAEQERICVENKAIVEFFLKTFRQKHPELELGTRFYTDVTVLHGPSTAQAKYLDQVRPELGKRWKDNEIAIYNVKWAGASFVTEYKKIFLDDGKIYINPKDVPVGSFMICEDREYPVPVDIANAVRKLCHAQEYRSAIYCAHKAEMERGMSFVR